MKKMEGKQIKKKKFTIENKTKKRNKKNDNSIFSLKIH
jgi:hypothetical protein